MTFKVIDKKTGKEADTYKIALKEDWAKHLIYCDIEGFAIEEDGSLVLLDECGNVAYCPVDRFEIVFEEEETDSWIPVTERLHESRDWYLGIFKEPDTGWINPLPFICDYVGSETRVTTKDHWILRNVTDEDRCLDYYRSLECVAWRPLPEPYL